MTQRGYKKDPITLSVSNERPEIEIPAIPAPTIFPLPQVQEAEDEEVQVLLLSDLQIGLKTPSYNAKVCRARVEFLFDKVGRICLLHRQAYPIRKLVIPMLGDMLHNELIGRQIDLHELEKVVYDQLFEVALPILTDFLQSCLQLYDEVEVYGVRGNHGTLGKFMSEKGNWDMILYRFLKERLREQQRIKFDLAEDNFYQIAKVFGHKIYMAHGDQIPITLNLPWYGITQRTMRLRESLPAGEKNFSAACYGHFHNASLIWWCGFPIFINGTVSSDNPFPLRRLGLAEHTAQVTFGVHPNRLPTWTYTINLEKIK